MYDSQFSSFLEKTFSEEYVQLINLCRDTIYCYGDSTLESSLYMSMPEFGDYELYQSKSIFETAIRSRFYHILEQFGIRTEIHELYKLNDLVRALQSVEESISHEDITMLCENVEVDGMGKLEEILFFVTGNEGVRDIVMSITVDDVDELIQSIHDLHLEYVFSQVGEATDFRPDKNKLNKVKKYKELFPETLITNLLNNEEIFTGIPLKDLMNIVGDDLLKMMPMYPRLVVENFVGIAILTGIPVYEFNTTLKTVIRQHFNNLRYNQTLALELDKLMQERGNEIGQI